MADALSDLYLSLLKKALTRHGLEPDWRWEPYEDDRGGVGAKVRLGAARAARARGLELVRRTPVDLTLREIGRDWPETAETMIGLARLGQLQDAIDDVIANDVPGDMIETGVWRGGACIFMRGVLAARGVNDRIVWAADSFEGLPKPSGAFSADDAGIPFWDYEELAVSQEQVEANFAKYGLLDDQVRFLKGWFKDTLPAAPIERLALMRLDGDMYESTIQVLDALYPKLSHGGYVIVDDYGSVPACREAVDDFRRDHSINDEIKEIDWTGVYWQRPVAQA